MTISAYDSLLDDSSSPNGRRWIQEACRGCCAIAMSMISTLGSSEFETAAEAVLTSCIPGDNAVPFSDSRRRAFCLCSLRRDVSAHFEGEEREKEVDARGKEGGRHGSGRSGPLQDRHLLTQSGVTPTNTPSSPSHRKEGLGISADRDCKTGTTELVLLSSIMPPRFDIWSSCAEVPRLL